MAWKLDGTRSIHSQLTAVIRGRIISGYYPPGSRLASVRELAEEAGVNPNTMQRALAELESTGVIFSQRTSGRFVTADLSVIKSLRLEEAERSVRTFVDEMRGLGLSAEEAEEMVRNYVESTGKEPAGSAGESGQAMSACESEVDV